MAKFSGLVGYIEQQETRPGVWSPVTVERFVRGDVLRQSSTSQNGNKINDDILLNHRFSFVADSYAFQKYYLIKWIEVDGVKWEVNNVEIQRPRIIISIGGVWNG